MKQILLVLALATLPWSTLAQESGNDAGQDATTGQGEGQVQEQSQEQAQAPAGQDPANVQARAPESGEGNDVDDYEASEEISEDLSVSYPVDI